LGIYLTSDQEVLVIEDVTCQLVLRAAPSKVFCSLVRAASEEGRVCGVEDFGAMLTFTPTRGIIDQAGRMRATVRACDEGALVSIGRAEPPDHRRSLLAVEARSVATLVRQLRRHYDEALDAVS
jgi:hypothetical protein